MARLEEKITPLRLLRAEEVTPHIRLDWPVLAAWTVVIVLGISFWLLVARWVLR